MAIQNYSLNASRIGKLKGEILAHAVPVEVLGICGQQKQMPKNNGDTVVYRRWLPYGATTSVPNQFFQANAGVDRATAMQNAHLTAEGVTPTAESITPQDVTVTLQQYSVLYGLTDKTVDLYEDDVPAEMKRQVGERIALVREMVRYGALKACTNLFYGGTGSSIGTVNGKITLNLLRKVARSLKANHAKTIREILAPSANFATAPVEAAYIVFAHTNAEADVRDLPGFKHVAEYGTRKPINEYEIGSVENFRFVLSPELIPLQGASGVTTGVGSTGLDGTSSYIDVYPFIVAAEDAWGQVALRGADSLDPTYIAPGQKDKNDPLGQRGYIGAKFYMSCKVLNDGWMALIHAGVSAL